MKPYKIYLMVCLGLAFLPFCDSKDQENKKKSDKDTLAEIKKPAVEIDEEATARAYIMGAVEVKRKTGLDSILQKAATKQHYKEFSTQWAKLENNRLVKIRPWRDKELAAVNKEGSNLFYPFSGPDFLNAYEFFPNCDNYLMFGLEPDGQLVNIRKMPPNYLAGLRDALGEIFERNYFITSFMGRELWGKGVLPIINIFLARTGNQIVKINRFYLEKDGKPTLVDLDKATPKDKLSGITIEFLNEKKEKSQKLWYVGTDVADEKMKSKMELVAFIKSFPSKITFIKSASYILHNTNFQVMRDLVVNDTEAVLQDDTGVRYEVFREKGWKIKLYGKYARPIADFGGYTYQPDLARAFQADSTIQPLKFTFGYHWNTDKTSLLLCTKK